MAIETDITKLVFNKMSQEKYEELKANGELVNNEFYITPDSNIDIDIDIPENVVEADNYVNAKLWKGTLAEYKALESYDDSVTYIITDDVVEGGTIIDLTDYVKNTDYATTSTAGVIKAYINNGFGINNSGQPFSQTVTLSSYKGYGGNFFIGKGTLENIKYDFVKDGVVNNNISLSEANKEKARNWIGASAEVIQQSSLSDLPADRNAGKIFQYTGETTEDFVNGYFYKSVTGESKYVSSDPHNITFDYDLFWSELENAGITLETLQLIERDKIRGGFSIMGLSESETEYRVSNINGVDIDVLLTKSVQSSQNIIGTSTRWYYTYTTIYEWKPIGVQSDNSSLKKLNTTQITNCITEIPQDIKLELVDGTLTLKAGSKVYVPNGFEEDGVTKKFDEIIIESDLTNTTTANSPLLVTVYNNTVAPFLISKCFSGNAEPSSPTNGTLWYDTTSNKLKVYANSVWNERNDSLPIVLATANGTAYTSIDQIFNGFGYIGSTVFVLPGVKGLIPNGRNEDGSLKNIEVIISKIFIHDTYIGVKSILHLTQQGTITVTPQTNYIKQISRPTFQKSACWEDTTNNIIWKTIASSTYWEDGNRKVLNFGKANYSDGRITELTINLPFRAVDYSDSSTVSGWAMPSDKYINLTIGATGSTYTAPANGLFYVRGTWNSESAGIYIYDNSYCDYAQTGFQGAAEGYVNHWVKKGTEVTIKYNNVTIIDFKFVYAQGEK